jgi:hypothetical protein
VFVETYDQRVRNGEEILCITSDRDRAQQTRVAIGTRCRFLHVCTLGANAKLLPLFSMFLEKTVPIALGFADNNAKDIIVFGMYDGLMYVRSSQKSQTVLISLVTP